jgi:hypothetical protein
VTQLRLQRGMLSFLFYYQPVYIQNHAQIRTIYYRSFPQQKHHSQTPFTNVKYDGHKRTRGFARRMRRAVQLLLTLARLHGIRASWTRPGLKDNHHVYYTPQTPALPKPPPHPRPPPLPPPPPCPQPAAPARWWTMRCVSWCNQYTCNEKGLQCMGCGPEKGCARPPIPGPLPPSPMPKPPLPMPPPAPRPSPKPPSPPPPHPPRPPDVCDNTCNAQNNICQGERAFIRPLIFSVLGHTLLLRSLF